MKNRKFPYKLAKAGPREHSKSPIQFFLSILIFFLVVIIFLTSKSEAVVTPLLFVKSIGQTGFQQGYAVTNDDDGNLYTTGYFRGSNVDFDSDNVVTGDTKSSVGFQDTFIVKYDSTGLLTYLKSFGGTDMDIGRAIKVDDAGNIYVGGVYVSSNVDFDPDNVVSGDTQSASSLGDLFLAKYNNTGVLQWVKSIGGFGNDYVDALFVDATGNVYTTGSYEGTNVDFDPDNVVSGDTKSTTGGTPDMYIAKYGNDGVLQWVKTTDEPASGASPYGISVDGAGNVYVGGGFGGTVDFDTDNVVTGDTQVAPPGTTSLFITKYNSSGTLQWVKTVDGSGFSFVFGVTLDGSANVYMTGYYQGTNVDFDQDNSVSGDTKTANGGFDLFIAKYNTSGVLQWVKSVGGTDEDRGNGVAVDSLGDVYVSGYFVSTNVDFDPDNVVPNDVKSADYYDIFTAKYDSSGLLQWVKSAGGPGDDESYAVSVDNDANVYITGYYESANLDFDPDNVISGDTKSPTASFDIFIVKYAFLNQIINLPVGLDAVDLSDVSLEPGGLSGSISSTQAVKIKDSVDNLMISEIVVNMITDRNWSGVTGDSDATGGKSFVSGITSAPGAASTHTFYVPIPTGNSSDRVVLCPSAASLAQVSVSCSGAVTKQESDSDTDKVTISGQQYWKVTGLSGTGGIATNYTPPSTPQNTAPTINITDPDGSVDMSAQTYTIKWEDSDPDDDATISFYYDSDNSGEDGTLIIANLSEDDSANEYVWDVTGLPEGSYYVYAVIDDGEADPAVVYSSGPFTKIPIECETINNDEDTTNNDSDCDGMPNTWETDHGLNVNDASDAEGNGDEDGCTNLDEYVNDKDPSVYDCEIPLPDTGEDISDDGNIVSQLVSQITNWINSPQAEDLANKVLTPVLAVPHAAFAISALASIAPILANSPAVLLPGIFGVLTRKKKNHWGIIYDKKTRKPIAFAVVRLVGVKDTVTRVTDLEGRYSFVTSPGDFRLTVSHSDYKGFSDALKVGQDNTVSIDLDIALEPKVFSFFEKIWYEIRQFLRNFVKNFGFVVVVIGLLFSIVAFVISPILINGLILAMYVVLLALYRRINTQFPRNWGRAVDSVNSKAIAQAFVKLFKEEQGGSRLIDTAVTDERGKYGFLIDSSDNYLLLASAPGYIFPSSKEKHEKAWNNVVIRVTVGKEKVLRDDILLDPQASTQTEKPSQEAPAQKSSPFA